MKRIRYDGSSLVTGNDVAEALLAYAEEVVERARAVTVEIPVLEPNGTIVTHQLLLGPATTFDVVDIDGVPPFVGEFPLPEFPSLASVALAFEPGEAPDMDWDERPA